MFVWTFLAKSLSLLRRPPTQAAGEAALGRQDTKKSVPLGSYTLSSLPPDLIAGVVQYLDPCQVGNLIFSGDRSLILHLRAHGVVTSWTNWKTFQWPRMMALFPLQTLCLYTPGEIDSHKSFMADIDWRLLPKSLTKLVLDFPNATHALLAQLPQTMLKEIVPNLRLLEFGPQYTDAKPHRLLPTLPRSLRQLQLPSGFFYRLPVGFKLPSEMETFTMSMILAGLGQAEEEEWKEVFGNVSTLFLNVHQLHACHSLKWIPPTVTSLKLMERSWDLAANANARVPPRTAHLVAPALLKDLPRLVYFELDVKCGFNNDVVYVKALPKTLTWLKWKTGVGPAPSANARHLAFLACLSVLPPRLVYLCTDPLEGYGAAWASSWPPNLQTWDGLTLFSCGNCDACMQHTLPRSITSLTLGSMGPLTNTYLPPRLTALKTRTPLPNLLEGCTKWLAAFPLRVLTMPDLLDYDWRNTTDLPWDVSNSVTVKLTMTLPEQGVVFLLQDRFPPTLTHLDLTIRKGTTSLNHSLWKQFPATLACLRLTLDFDVPFPVEGWLGYLPRALETLDVTFPAFELKKVANHHFWNAPPNLTTLYVKNVECGISEELLPKLPRLLTIFHIVGVGVKPPASRQGSLPSNMVLDSELDALVAKAGFYELMVAAPKALRFAGYVPPFAMLLASFQGKWLDRAFPGLDVQK